MARETFSLVAIWYGFCRFRLDTVKIFEQKKKKKKITVGLSSWRVTSVVGQARSNKMFPILLPV